MASLLAAPLGARASSRPAAPPQICINDKCVTTPPAAAPSQIKWNPGHYMASNSVIYAGQSLSRVQSEMDDINGWDKILGYRAYITWGALEPSQGNYDFSLIDTMLNRLKTQYNKPKRLVLVVLPGTFSSAMGGNDGGTLPKYLQQSSAYGASPVSGRYGWWGANSKGASTGAYVAALYRPAVMDRFIALVNALAAKYDNEPYFEGFMIQENSWMVGAWSKAPDYSESANIAQLERMLSASTKAFAHTSVIMQNTWSNSVPTTFNFEQWMVANRIAPSSSDVLGQTAFDGHNYYPSMAWGLQAYCGVTNGSVTSADLRPKTHAMMDVEAPDMAGGYFGKFGGPFAPLDIVNSLNNTYKASHAFWTHLFGTESVFGGTVPSAAKWGNLAATVSANPLTNTSYPANYQ
jgi:hypothetical protein